MEILLVASACSTSKYNEVSELKVKKTIEPQQKFFRLVAEGLAAQQDVNVRVLSVLPLSASTCKKKIFRHQVENINGVTYEYLPFINGRVMRYLTIIINTFYYSIKWARKFKRSERVVITDPLVLIASKPARFVSKLKGIKSCALITDVPTLASDMKKDNSGLKARLLRWYQRISDNDCYKYDYYVTLTESINDVMNPHRRPYTIVEGVADVNDTSVAKQHNNNIIYAGGVYEMFGVKNLVEAFIALNNKDINLHIYGNGSYVEEVIRISESYSNVKYKGCVTPSEIVAIEKESMLLVNPRPTEEDFSKYSFPSKTMEYMLSGTPVVSTRLPGIPDEYFDHMYYFTGYNVASITEKLEEILSLDKEVLCKKGLDAHNFIMSKKNNVAQTKKIVELVKEITICK